MTSVAGGEPAVLSKQAIIDGWDEGLRGLEAIHHQTGNFIVDARGDEADAFCYGTAFQYLPNPSGQNTRTFVGSYDFHLHKGGGLWRIDRFKFNLKYIEGSRDLGRDGQHENHFRPWK